MLIIVYCICKGSYFYSAVMCHKSLVNGKMSAHAAAKCWQVWSCTSVQCWFKFVFILQLRIDGWFWKESGSRTTCCRSQLKQEAVARIIMQSPNTSPAWRWTDVCTALLSWPTSDWVTNGKPGPEPTWRHSLAVVVSTELHYLISWIWLKNEKRCT